MELEDVVTFCQQDWPCTSFAAFEKMRSKGMLCDLSINLRNHTFRAHRVVLAAGIPYFQSLYMSEGAETSEKDISQVGLDPDDVESLIQFAYTGRIDICFDNVHSLMRASSFLQLTLVFDACVEFLLGRLSDDVVITIHNLAHEFEIRNLTDATVRHILKNFENISKTEDFLNLPHSCVKEIISEDDLVASNEGVVFEALISWVKMSPSERHEVLPDLLNEVRLTHLQPDYLINRVTAEELVKTSIPCMYLLEDVKNYHLLPKDQVPLPKLKTQPRKFSYSNGAIYAVLYCHASGYSVYQCDFNNGRISQNLSPKEGPHGSVFGVVALNEKIYMFHEKTIRTFDVRSLEWKVLDQPKHCCVRGAAFVAHKDAIYCFGSSSAEFSNKVRCFDTRLKKWLKEGTMRSGRYNSAAASLGEYIYVTGGFWGYLVPSYMSLLGYSGGSTVEKYSPSSKQCKKVAPMLTPRENHFCTSANGKIYVFGGGGVTGRFLNTAEVYDPFTRHWTFITPMPSPRSSFSVVSFNGKIYAVEADRGSICYEVFDFGSNRWIAGLPLRSESGLVGNLLTVISFSPACY